MAEISQRVVVLSGSPRGEYNCSGETPKTYKLAKHAVQNAPEGMVADLIDLGNKQENVIYPCNGCVSTTKFLCQWPCTCYGPRSQSPQIPDRMYTEGIYDKLEACDAFVVFTPIHWYSVTTPIKSMFDRLVCASMTPTARWAFDEEGYGKDVELAIKIAKSGEYDNMLSNHLAGRVGAFFVHGDGGADDYTQADPPETYNEEDEAENDDPHRAVSEIVDQCRYMGIDVPQHLIYAGHVHEGLPYYENNERLAGRTDLFDAAVEIMQRVYEHLNR